MAKLSSTPLDLALIEKATEQANALKVTLGVIMATSVRSTQGKKPLNKNGRKYAKIARNAANTYPEAMPQRFNKNDFDISLIFDEKVEPLLSLIKDTADTFEQVFDGNSSDIEFHKRKIYVAITEAAEEEPQYKYYAEQLAEEYAGQGKRSDKGSDNKKGTDNNKGTDTPLKDEPK